MSDYDLWLVLPYLEQEYWEQFCSEHETTARELAHQWIADGKYKNVDIEDVVHFALELLYERRHEKNG